MSFIIGMYLSTFNTSRHREVINMFKARIQCIQMMSVNADLSDTSSDEEDLEEEATLENILAVIDDLCQVKHTIFQ